MLALPATGGSREIAIRNSPSTEPSPFRQSQGQHSPRVRATHSLNTTTPPMSAPSSRAARITAKLAPHAWWILLLTALASLWVATGRRIARVEAITNSPTWSVDAPERDANSPTGFERGQRKLIVPGHHNASFWWIMEAQESVETGSLRLRHVDYDAPPDGREIRRTAPYRWWLVAVGGLNSIFTGEPVGYAIERGALIADPLLLGMLLILGAIYAAQRFGSFAAVGFVVGGASLFPLAANFQPGAPDPHSLAWLLALGSVLPLLGSTRSCAAQDRNHFVAAGILGGIGFWNDATTQAPVLLAIFLGAAVRAFIHSRSAEKQTVPSCHWRAWAVAGALTTLAASVFEFAPGYFSGSLDSVSPVHAVIWWGFGEALHAAEIWFRKGHQGFDRRSLALLVAGIGAITAWPVVGLMSGSGALLASDFYALELANHPHGGIAPSFSAWYNRADGAAAKWATLLPCLLLFVLGAGTFLGKLERESRGRLAFVLSAALLTIALAHQQLRWWNVVDIFALAALTVLFAAAETGNFRTRFAAFCLALILVFPGLFVGFPPQVQDGTVNNLSNLEAQALVERDFSYWLAVRGGAERNVLFSTPIFSGAAAFYGGFDVVVSSDAENKTGYLTAVRIASAVTAQEVAILLNSRGITHVALPLWDPALDQLVRIGANLPSGQPLPQNTFSVSLRHWDMPLWMRPMNYTIPKETGLESFELMAFALQSEQEPDLALSRLADLFVERGQLREAQAVSESLKDYPRSVVALGAIAKVNFAMRDRESLTESLETLIPYMSRRSVRDLPADRRISLAVLFMQTNHIDLARDQVTGCFEILDSETLRTLTPTTIVGLVALGRSLDIPFPTPELEEAAMTLIPPGLRSGLTQK